MKHIIYKSFFGWLPLGATIFIICNIMYIAVQQNIRLSANDLPLQEALNAKEDLQKGLSAEQNAATYRKIDMQTSLEPFIIFYSASGDALASSATINNKTPKMLTGVLNHAKENKENRLSWQPAPNVRNAIVVLPYSANGNSLYIVCGHSLYEVEQRVHLVMWQCFAGMLFTLFTSFVLTFFIQYLKHKKKDDTA